MSLKILGAGIFQSEELATFAAPPAWRKATRNMIMATASVERALQQIPELNIASDPSVGYVLTSTSGELDTSTEFMATWAKSQMARPVLFQNSLHNATTGFVSIHFKITGPVFTASSLEAAPQECVETAESLLLENSCRVCLITVVEGHKAIAQVIDETQVKEGACTLIVTTGENAKMIGLKTLGELPLDLKTLNYTRDPNTLPLVGIDRSGFFKIASELGAAR